MSTILNNPLGSRFHVGLLQGTLLLTAALSAASARPACAQDAKTILQNMMKTYRAMSSYEGRGSADRREILANGTVLIDESLTSTMYYQKPNKLRLEFQMPSGGRSLYYDGTTLTYFQSKSQTYNPRPVQAANLQELSKPLLDFQVGSRFDTLYFLSGKDIPSTVSALSRKPDETRNGRPVYVVTGREANGYTKAFITWKWMIDKQTNLLARVEGGLTNVPRHIEVMQGKKKVMQTVIINSLLTQSVVDPKPNARIDSQVFVFTPTPGARRIVPVTTPVKGK